MYKQGVILLPTNMCTLAPRTQYNIRVCVSAGDANKTTEEGGRRDEA